MAGKFNKTVYMKEYMRQRRAKERQMSGYTKNPSPETHAVGCTKVPSELMAADEIERLRDEKRDMFAAQALAGFCANSAIFASNEQSGWDLVNCDNRTLAREAYKLADAMMEVRKSW